ncbi:hypothetical protein OE09_0584 [Flavobacteriaceae bacterium MAR_2010_72]|nr:hypothetical protein OE09_0584 [Flavobacteriaceae bacterium MAR_2010_72]TVZ57768.1 hypothetical protein NA63_0255 [Flavobacteriaceae bacterium MAR_2010_105]
MALIEMNTGFSIELEGPRLEHRGTHNGLPLYESLGGKITAIALVNKPAIGELAVGNDEEKTILGAVMIPNLKIYRNAGPLGQEPCYWYFSAETIEQLRKTFDGTIKLGH